MCEKYFVAVGYGGTERRSNLIVLKLTDNGKIQRRQEFYYDGGPSYLVEKVISDHRSFIYVAFEKTNEIVKFVWEKGKLIEEKDFRHQEKDYAIYVYRKTVLYFMEAVT